MIGSREPSRIKIKKELYASIQKMRKGSALVMVNGYGSRP